MSSELPRPIRPAVGQSGRRLLLWVLLLLLAAVGVFAIVVRIDRVVVGQGMLVAVDERSDVRLSTSGVVADLLADEGEQVRAGQVMLRLEDAAERGRRERLVKTLQRETQNLATLDKSIAVLEQTLKTGVTAPVAGSEAADVIEAWRVARDAHAEEIRRRANVIPGRIALARARLAARKATVEAAEVELARAEAIVKRLSGMAKEGLINLEEYEAAVPVRDANQKALQGARAVHEEATQSLAMIGVETVERVASSRARLESAKAALRDEVARLRSVRAAAETERSGIQAGIDATDRALRLLVVRAPVSGLVSFAAPMVPGDRVEADRHAFSISTSTLVAAQASFANRDAGALRPGAECKIKLDAFPFERYGILKARLESVALEPVVDPATGASVFPARLAVQRVEGGARRMTLRPGLTLVVEIVTERPRLISVLFEPIYRLFGVGAEAELPSPLSTPAPTATVAVTPRTEFVGQRALHHVAQLARMGPRHLGSDAVQRAQEYVRRQLEEAGLVVESEDHEIETPSGMRTIRNIHARFPDALDGALLLATHLDTKRLQGVAAYSGANEGASAAAVLLECARVMAGLDPRPAVRFVFFDGKEALGRSPRHGLYGSRGYVDRLVASGGLGTIGAVVVCDMLGDVDLRFTDELRSTPWVAKALLAAGRRIGHEGRFEASSEDSIPIAVRNDHIPFLRTGVPAALLCDFDFGGPDPVRRTARNRFRHTDEDRLERVSAPSLQVAGDVLVEMARTFRTR